MYDLRSFDVERAKSTSRLCCLRQVLFATWKQFSIGINSNSKSETSHVVALYVCMHAVVSEREREMKEA